MSASRFESVVADIRLESRTGTAGVWSMSLERTEFAVGLTGWLEAVTRSGTKLEIPVTGVTLDDDGVVWHTVEKPLAAGTDVIGTVRAAG
jgi:alanyl-tRNA synthetase